MAAIIDIKNSKLIGTAEQYKRLVDLLGGSLDVTITECAVVIVDTPITGEALPKIIKDPGSVEQGSGIGV